MTTKSSGVNLVNSNSFRLRFARKFLRSLSKIKAHKPVNNLSLSVSEFRKRSQRIKMVAYSSMARAVGPRKAWARALLFKLHTRPKLHTLMRKRRLRAKKATRNRSTLFRRYKINEMCQPDSDNQVDKLRGLVPGGETMDVVTLLEETAHYIHCLTTQVKVMKAISHHYYSD